MKLIETTIAAGKVRIRFADADDPALAAQWIDVQVRAELGEDPFLSEIQLSAPHRARTVIGQEMNRLKSLAGRSQ